MTDGWTDLPSLSWSETKTRHDEIRTQWRHLDGRRLLSDVTAWVADNVPMDAHETVVLHGGQLSWQVPETPTQRVERLEWHAAADARRETWERNFYETLKEKYEPSKPQ